MVLVTVIVPTVGSQTLRRCVESVLNQTVPCNILVVADGPETDVFDAIEPDSLDRIKIIELPENIGGPPERLLGHPVYAAMPFLCKTKYVAFLDEDNFMDADHVESLRNLCESQGLQWAYSLRKVCEDGKVRCMDNCESLGGIAHAFDRSEFFVDTSCFLVRRDVAMTIGHRWYHPHADRPVSKFLIDEAPEYGCTFQATMNYDFSKSNARNQAIEYFDHGNAKMNYDFQAKKTFFVTKPCPWIRGANQVPAHDKMPAGSVLLVPASKMSDLPLELLRKVPRVTKTLVILDPPSEDNCQLYERDVTDIFTNVMTPWSDFRCPTRVPCPQVVDLRNFPWHIDHDANQRTRRPFVRLPSVLRSSEVLVVREVPVRWLPPTPNPNVTCECYPETPPQSESLRKHAFALVYEDHDAKGFVDALFWKALAAGTIPVYMGPRENLAVNNIPKECYVDGTLFPGEALAVFLDVADVGELQRRVLEHRPTAFKNVLLIS
jgi:hypothetical protein